MLSDSDSEQNDLHTLTINEHFAKAFEYKKEREELAKLKEKYGSESGSSHSDSEDSQVTEEDTDGEELTPAMDAAILRTLALIRKKDPTIYEDGRQVFDVEHTRTRDKAPIAKPRLKEKSKPLTIREAALASALAGADLHSRSPSPRPLTHTEEQAVLRLETRAAFHGAIDSGSRGDDDDLLVPRSRDETESEEKEYMAFLQQEVGEELHNFINVDTNEVVGASEYVEVFGGDKKSEEKKKTKGEKEQEKLRERNREKDDVRDKKITKMRDKKSKDEGDQEFLVNYIFNRGWIDRSNRRVPTYNEIVGSSSKHSKQELVKSQRDLDVEQNSDDNEKEAQSVVHSDEDSFDDLADAFETSYNFRFEEPGGALILSFPRNLMSARRESTTRKDARARKRERQQAEKQTLLEARRGEIRKERALIEAAVAEEDQNSGSFPVEEDTFDREKSKKQQRKEELARLKALKANELRRKLEMVSLEGGLGGIGDKALTHLDLDADWDPSKHDAQMAGLYGDDIVGDDDTEKPIWDDDINIDDIIPPSNTKSKAQLKKQRKKKNKKVNEDKDGVDVDDMDADLNAGAPWDDDDEDWRGTEEERRRKVDAYMDEVVNRLGFSGITSHMPTRFHYTPVASENYGLTSAEILLATDAELNAYVGLKKLAPYRIDRGGKGKKNWDPNRVQRLKEFRESLHSRRVGSRYEGAWSAGGGTNAKSRATEAQGEKNKRKGKKERAKLKAMKDEGDEGEQEGTNTGFQLEIAGEPQKRKRESDVSSHSCAPSHSAAGDVGDGAPKKKRKRRHKQGSSEAGETERAAIS